MQNQENYNLSEKRQSTETNIEVNQILELCDKEIRAAIIKKNHHQITRNKKQETLEKTQKL